MVSKDDEYFSMPWDTAHWLDRVMEKIRERSESSAFFKRLIKRSNRFHTMFGYGKGRIEYSNLAKLDGFYVMETVNFATTRFFSSAFRQWEMIFKNYEHLTNAFIKFREDEDDDCDETKFEVNEYK